MNIDRFELEDFEIENTSVWSFPKRGKWATHDSKYRGNWSPYIPRNILKRYSKEDDLVLDQFVGSGTSLIEAKILNRNIIGVDINPKALKICEEKIKFDSNTKSNVTLRKGDSRNLDFLKSDSIDLIMMHPPYSNIIKYSEDIDGDLSLMKLDDFYKSMKLVAKESYRVLKEEKFCAVLMGDTRKKGHVIPMGFNIMNIFIEEGFILKEIVIKEQHNCRATGFWKTNSIKYNFLLLAHEYLFIFHK
ncbi:TRM11 family SAM-dependent methyltransferase [Peptoniphilus stercorisuis]|uniref:Methyltransferase n=1 Tax=Peptoniphilus stercorisuis TaxID=1436965 RepID=A0ABS4K9Q8_9FIRM|nr:DNA methyltransferase [Peptoniphilus stercorisuis]MBP2024507.1 DNA modification methylase [Peptoniphilus stercorisuis]